MDTRRDTKSLEIASPSHAVRYTRAMRYLDTTDRVAELEERLTKLVEDRRVAATEVAKLDIEIQSVRTSLRSMTTRKGTRNRTLTAKAQAGRHATEAHAAMRRARRPLSQKEVGDLAKIGTGTLTHAMQALVSEGLAEPTGEKKNRSLVYRLTEKGLEGRVTRRPPGS